MRYGTQGTALFAGAWLWVLVTGAALQWWIIQGNANIDHDRLLTNYAEAVAYLPRPCR